MVARERNSNENNAHFIYRLTFFYAEIEPEYQNNFPEGSVKDVSIFWEKECYCFLKFFETNTIQDGVKTSPDCS